MGLFEYQKRSYPILRRMGSGKIRAEVNEEFVAWYHAPWWLTNRLWKIQAFRASCGDWTFCPRTFLVVPNDSMVFCYARVNDVKGLQGLFAKRKASPYDCSFNGFTPLHVCCRPHRESPLKSDYPRKQQHPVTLRSASY